LQMFSTVLIVAAHPDDEVLGCGGTIAKFVKAGAKVHIIFLADGVSSRKDVSNDLSRELIQRRIASKAALLKLGVHECVFGDYPDNKMDTIPLLNIVHFLEELIALIQPDVILTHHAGDLNIDHRLTHEAVVTACRPQPGHSVKTILCFEVPSSTEWQLSGSKPTFLPNWYVDITLTLHQKISALGEYDHELREWPHPRSVKGVESLAFWRGATIGVEAAEAFQLGRHLE
jgi:LmbE family N-acetylglucosaminyl deacetylase